MPALQRVARGTPLFFVGDLTDRGTPLEAQLTSGILHAGTRLVFVTGNHDSDSEAQELADDGAIVLTEHGRLLRGGRYGPMVVRVAGLRVAGYGDPFRRRRARGYVQQGALPAPSVAEQNLFAEWLAGLEDKVDVVMVHEPALAAKAIDALRRDPPSHPIVLLVGHTHRADISIDRDFTAAQRRDGRRRRDGQPQRGVEDRRGADDLRRRAAVRPAGGRPRGDRPRQRVGDGEALPARRTARDRGSQIA